MIEKLHTYMIHCTTTDRDDYMVENGYEITYQGEEVIGTLDGHLHVVRVEFDEEAVVSIPYDSINWDDMRVFKEMENWRTGS